MTTCFPPDSSRIRTNRNRAEEIALDFLLLRLLVLVFRRALRISALHGALLRFRHRKPSLEKRRSWGYPARSGRHLRKALAPGSAR